MMDEKVIHYIKEKRDIARERLEAYGYFDEGWDRINELAPDVLSAYRLGRAEAIYDLTGKLLKMLEVNEE